MLKLKKKYIIPSPRAKVPVRIRLEKIIHILLCGVRNG
jgi:hypothetical protein